MQNFPTCAPQRAAAQILCVVARCTQGRSVAEPYSDGPQAMKSEGVSFGALCVAQAHSVLADCDDKTRHPTSFSEVIRLREHKLLDMPFEKMACKYERMPKAT